MEVQIKRLHPDAILPQYKSKWAAGADIYALESARVYPGQTIRIRTGLAIAIPKGYEGQIRARSSLAAKHGLIIPNGPGTIDADYRGEFVVVLHMLVNRFDLDPVAGIAPYSVAAGDRIAQLVIAPVCRGEFLEVDTLAVSDRGAGGFGSTGR